MKYNLESRRAPHILTMETFKSLDSVHNCYDSTSHHVDTTRRDDYYYFNPCSVEARFCLRSMFRHGSSKTGKQIQFRLQYLITRGSKDMSWQENHYLMMGGSSVAVVYSG